MHRLSTFCLALLPLGFLLAMVAAPLAALSLYDDGSGGVVWADVLADGYIRGRMVWTVVQAAVTAVLTLLLGVPAAWVLARLAFPGRALILRLLMLPFVMPTLVAGMGVLALFGANGLLFSDGRDTPYLLLYGNVFFNLPVLVRAAYQGFNQVPAARLTAAQTLGADAWARFRHIELPVLRPWLAGGMCLVFLYCFSGFGLALLLGGTAYSTVEVEIYRLITVELDMAQAGVLVWLSLGITLVSGAAYAFFSRRTHSGRRIVPLPPQAPSRPLHYAAIAAAAAVLAVCCALPLAAVWAQAATAGASWRVLLETDTLSAAANTLRFTFSAMLPALILGIGHAALARRLPWLRGITFLPFMVSPVCISFGLLLLYPQWTASLPLLIAAYALLAYPFITKDLLAAWDALPERYARAAQTLGAGGFQTALRITAPLLLPAVRRGTTLAAATCAGEFAATLFLSRPEWTTLTTLIYQYLGTAGSDNHDKAMVLTAALMTLAAAVFLLLDPREQRPQPY
ncbi:iron ABC transporter permease [Neisseria leonii]|uniref:Iron ABC transporter permease n=1 Tax=Neisseria leonii TaxID=2995413 RepID=A0A9X4E2R1_9NEIS|nr:iron ABC transporter permease [Neisseria sp. 51.81]MDD9328139.1 iron ABC transporter permease [Neisseria sp. 51.81]